MKVEGILDKKKRYYKNGMTHAELQSEWRLQQKNGKLVKDKRFANVWTWEKYRENACEIIRLM
jgi:hypothetical protein